MKRKPEGFEGQRAIVLPKKIIEVCNYSPPVNLMFITDIGFYPRAKYHYRERPSGIAQNILIYCIEGEGWLEIPTGKFEIKPNNYLVIPADMPHSYGADENNPWTIYWAHYKGLNSLYFSSMLSKQNKRFVSSSYFLEERIKIFDSIYRNLETGYSLDNLLYCSISFQYFLASLSFEEKFASSYYPIKKDAVDISIDYMRSYLNKTPTLETLASAVNLSVSHYSSVFKKKTGYTPLVYFNHIKIQQACQYLQFTSLKIYEIALKLGIKDPYYFSRMFTKVMGQSPNGYRRKKH